MRKLEDDYPLLVKLRRADNLAQALQFHRSELHELCEKLYEEAAKASEESLGNKLAIDGNDLLNAGALPGKNVGYLLGALADDVLDQKVANEKESLLQYAKVRYQKCFGGGNE